MDDVKGPSFRQALPSFIHVCEVPSDFVTKRAKYKARALEYFRQYANLDHDDWVLHLDEESNIDEKVIKACFDFIERGNEHIGMVMTLSLSRFFGKNFPVYLYSTYTDRFALLQGTIYYNAENHWKNKFLSVAEMLRIAEDFGHFQLPSRLVRRPILGYMHGSWILINGRVENEITWETACMAEDYWFALAVRLTMISH